MVDYLIEFLIDSYSLVTCTAVCMDACTSMGLRVLPWPRYHATHTPWTLLKRVLGFFSPLPSLSLSVPRRTVPSARQGVTKMYGIDGGGCTSLHGDAPPSCAANAARSSPAVNPACFGDERGHLALTLEGPRRISLRASKLTSYRSSSGEGCA